MFVGSYVIYPLEVVENWSAVKVAVVFAIKYESTLWHASIFVLFVYSTFSLHSLKLVLLEVCSWQWNWRALDAPKNLIKLK